MMKMSWMAVVLLCGMSILAGSSFAQEEPENAKSPVEPAAEQG